MEVALYVRVSTTRQQQTQIIEQQLIRLREHLATRSDWHLAEEQIYRDDGSRGAKLNRPGLDRLRDRAALATFDLVLMTARDRLARNDGHHMLQLGELAQRGCQVEFLERPISQVRTISACSRAGGRWPNMNGPCWPTGCGGAGKPHGAAATCCPGASPRTAT